MTAPLAVVHDYDDLVLAMKTRADEIGVSMEVLDELAGLGAGYTGKLFGPGQVKTMGLQSLFLLAETLGLSLALHLDLEAVKRMESRWKQRDELRRRPDKMRLGEKARRRIMKEMGRLGGQRLASARLASGGMAALGARGGLASARKLSRKERRARARKASETRWNGVAQ